MKRLVFLILLGLLLSSTGAFAAPAATPNDEKEGTISGLAIQRPQGGWLGIEIKDNSFVLTFYNAKKKPTPADKTGAILRWAVHYQPNDERTELTPTGDPAVFTSQYAVKPPHSFILHISLLSDSKDVESYVVNFSE